MSKMCFVISPMGPKRSATRVRADYVFNTYIAPACKLTDHEARRADSGVGRDIVSGTNTALQNAPLAVAYMGPIPNSVTSPEGTGCWNPNVMIEIGYRLASRLPLIFLCDQNSDGRLPELPLSLTTLSVIGLPRPDPQDPNWVDTNAQEIVDSLIARIREEERGRRILDSTHPVAAINAASAQLTTPSNLYYTAASEFADDVFGLQAEDGRGSRLVGRTLEQFYSGVEKRMHPAQWRAFKRDQQSARTKLKSWATGKAEKQSVASVPIVFENHENDDYNHRAFLPIIVQNYRPRDDGFDWYNLRVLYLNVTTATKKISRENGEEYYVCSLDPETDDRLEPLKPHEPIRIFLSYRRDNEAKVRAVYDWLVDLKPYVEPFIDTSMTAADNWLYTLEQSLQNSELCFLFLDGKDIGPGQQVEVDAILGRVFSREGKKYPVVPVLLPSPGSQPRMPLFLSAMQRLNYEDVTKLKLQQILWHWFGQRCPDDWALNDQSKPLCEGKKPLDEQPKPLAEQRKPPGEQSKPLAEQLVPLAQQLKRPSEELSEPQYDV
jgi:TIR domain